MALISSVLDLAIEKCQTGKEKSCSIYSYNYYTTISREGEVNSGGYTQRREASRYISTALHRP